MNPTSLIRVAEPGDIRHDRVGQLVKRGFDGITSNETRRAYRHALEMFLEFCGPGRESDALGRAGRELRGLAGRGREGVLHGRSTPGGH